MQEQECWLPLSRGEWEWRVSDICISVTSGWDGVFLICACCSYLGSALRAEEGLALQEEDGLAFATNVVSEKTSVVSM
jgi:hypothetical protein